MITLEEVLEYKLDVTAEELKAVLFDLQYCPICGDDNSAYAPCFECINKYAHECPTCGILDIHAELECDNCILEKEAERRFCEMCGDSHDLKSSVCTSCLDELKVETCKPDGYTKPPCAKCDKPHDGDTYVCAECLLREEDAQYEEALYRDFTLAVCLQCGSDFHSEDNKCVCPTCTEEINDAMKQEVCFDACGAYPPNSFEPTVPDFMDDDLPF